MDFDKIYADNYNRLLRTAKSFLHNEEDAQDATQDTYLKAYEHLDSFDGSSSLSTWLTQICINTCKDKLRKKKRETKYITPINVDAQYLLDKEEDKTDPMFVLDAAEVEASIYCLFLQMPDNIREALILRLSEGLSYKDIAEKMGIPVNTAKTWVRRGRKQLSHTNSPL